MQKARFVKKRRVGGAGWAHNSATARATVAPSASRDNPTESRLTLRPLSAQMDHAALAVLCSCFKDGCTLCATPTLASFPGCVCCLVAFALLFKFVGFGHAKANQVKSSDSGPDSCLLCGRNSFSQCSGRPAASACKMSVCL